MNEITNSPSGARGNYKGRFYALLSAELEADNAEQAKDKLERFINENYEHGFIHELQRDPGAQQPH